MSVHTFSSRDFTRDVSQCQTRRRRGPRVHH
jgi:hypothetical protein